MYIPPDHERAEITAMTGAQWLSCPDPFVMLEWLYRRRNDRKLRLFAVGACRWIWHLLSDERSRQAVEVAERFADKEAKEQELTKANGAAVRANQLLLRAEAGAAASTTNPDAWFAARGAAEVIPWAYVRSVVARPDREIAERTAAEQFARAKLAEMLRDVLPNPFRSYLFSPGWRSPTVVSLAQAIYLERAWDRMPILADAMEECGCDDGAILDHCRHSTVHIRGCAVVDAVLGRQ